MATKRISALTAASAAALTDQLAIEDNTNATKKVTAAQLATLLVTGSTINTALGYTAANAAALNATALTAGTVPLDRLSGITATQIAAGAAIADTQLATISTTGKVANSATTATAANTADAIVARDGDGDIAIRDLDARDIAATTLAGDGSAVTDLDADELTAGTVATARLGAGNAHEFAGIAALAAQWMGAQPSTLGITRDGAGLATTVTINGLALPVARSSGIITRLGGLTTAPAFARASAALNPETFASVSSGAPRYIDDEDSDVSAIYVEGATTNLVEHSEAFDNAWWTLTNLPASADATTAPDGTTTADALTENTANGYHEISRVIFTIGEPATVQVCAKSNGRDRFGFGTGLPGTNGAIFDVDTGTIVSVLGATTKARIEDLGSGWYRCTVSTPTATSGNWNLTVIDSGTNQTYTGDGSSGLYLWGAQGVAGLDAGTYIRTSGGPVTRALETLTLPAAGVLRPSEGAVVARFKMTQAMIDTAATIYRSLLDTRSGNYLFNIYQDIGSPPAWRVSLRNGAGTTQSVVIDGAGLAVGWHTIGFKWGPSALTTYLNGALINSVAPTGMPEQFGTDLLVGSNYSGGEQLGSAISLLAAYFEAPADADMLLITDPGHANAGADFRLTFAEDLDYTARVVDVTSSGGLVTATSRASASIAV